jgi:hypothetical protein
VGRRDLDRPGARVVLCGQVVTFVFVYAVPFIYSFVAAEVRDTTIVGCTLCARSCT